MPELTTTCTSSRMAGALRPAATAATLLLAGILVGSAVSPPSTAWGEVRAGDPTQHFQSGGQLSVPLLNEIAATLHQIDARLARLEAAAKQMQTNANRTRN